MTKQYRILVSYESEGKRLDIDRLRANMKGEGLYNLRIEQKEPIGKKHTVEIYFDADIPVSQTVMSQMMVGQDFVVRVLQEVLTPDGKWTNVDRTLPKTCQAENCKNRPEMDAFTEEDGAKRMYRLCKHHANLASLGVKFNVWDEEN